MMASGFWGVVDQAYQNIHQCQGEMKEKTL
jgi:hypothetical protein